MNRERLRREFDIARGFWCIDKSPEEIMRLFLGNFESDVNPFCTESEEERRFLSRWDRFVKRYFFRK